MEPSSDAPAKRRRKGLRLQANGRHPELERSDSLQEGEKVSAEPFTEAASGLRVPAVRSFAPAFRLWTAALMLMNTGAPVSSCNGLFSTRDGAVSDVTVDVCGPGISVLTRELRGGHAKLAV